jgi:hypothetical protein
MLVMSDKGVIEIILALKMVILVGVKKEQISAEHNTSNAFPELQSPYFKLVNNLKKFFLEIILNVPLHILHTKNLKCSWLS